MKNFWMTLGMLMAAAAVSFGAFYVANDDPAVRRAARAHDAMAWLRVEFQLDDRQFAAIEALHDDYSVQCAQHCSAIMSARRRQATAEEIAALERVCVDSMTVHFRRVAALMAPAQGERYLAIVLPRISHYAHGGAPTLQVQP